MQGIELRIKGKVQGVGFRPFVWLLANQYKLNGDVNNDGQGVLVRFVSPPADALEQFLSDLQNKLPPLAQITDITQRPIDWPEPIAVTGFTIRESENNKMDRQIISDAADPDANIIFGSVIDESLGDKVQVTVVATGFGNNAKSVPEFGKTTTTSRPAATTTTTNSGIPDIPVVMKR